MKNYQGFFSTNILFTRWTPRDMDTFTRAHTHIRKYINKQELRSEFAQFIGENYCSPGKKNINYFIRSSGNPGAYNCQSIVFFFCSSNHMNVASNNSGSDFFNLRFPVLYSCMILLGHVRFCLLCFIRLIPILIRGL